MRINKLIYEDIIYENLLEIYKILSSTTHHWILDCEIDNAVIEIKDDILYWKDGIFYWGYWKWGVFDNGEFRSGYWLGGILRGGLFNGQYKKMVIKGGKNKGKQI